MKINAKIDIFDILHSNESDFSLYYAAKMHFRTVAYIPPTLSCNKAIQFDFARYWSPNTMTGKRHLREVAIWHHESYLLFDKCFGY